MLYGGGNMAATLHAGYITITLLNYARYFQGDDILPIRKYGESRTFLPTECDKGHVEENLREDPLTFVLSERNLFFLPSTLFLYLFFFISFLFNNYLIYFTLQFANERG